MVVLPRHECGLFRIAGSLLRARSGNGNMYKTNSSGGKQVCSDITREAALASGIPRQHGAVAKAYVSDAAPRVTREAIQFRDRRARHRTFPPQRDAARRRRRIGGVENGDR
jgi:hypothetical protein